MKRILPVALFFILMFSAISVKAHRDGCHAQHSCPSDTGSYICGDMDHCSQCPDNQYCEGGVLRTTPYTPPEPVAAPDPAPATTPTPEPAAVETKDPNLTIEPEIEPPPPTSPPTPEVEVIAEESATTETNTPSKDLEASLTTENSSDSGSALGTLAVLGGGYYLVRRYRKKKKQNKAT